MPASNQSVNVKIQDCPEVSMDCVMFRDSSCFADNLDSEIPDILPMRRVKSLEPSTRNLLKMSNGLSDKFQSYRPCSSPPSQLGMDFLPLLPVVQALPTGQRKLSTQGHDGDGG
eukprot:2683482-Rhodomonas_salina.2